MWQSSRYTDYATAWIVGDSTPCGVNSGSGDRPFLGSKATIRETDYTLPPSAKVKNDWIHTSTPSSPKHYQGVDRKLF